MAQRVPDYNVPTHNATLFTWRGNQGCAKISDICRVNGAPYDCRIWNDSFDVGFFVVGRHTTKLFIISHYERDCDGNFVADHYCSYDNKQTITVYYD